MDATSPTALNPNGSSLDYVANAPYLGGGHRVGVQKQTLEHLALSARAWLLGYYAPVGTDPAADIIGWKALTDTGGPFDANPAADAMVDRAHRQPLGATTSTTAIAPAPALLANGWNDDLFPVDESLRYYNKVRAKYPNAPISMFHLDFGHSPRARRDLRRRPRGADRRRERLAGLLRQGRRVRARRRARRRRHPHLQVPGQRRRHALPRGRPGRSSRRARSGSTAPRAQTIVAPGTAPCNAFTSGDVCTTTASADNASRRDLQGPRRRRRAYTLAGSPTIVAKLDVKGANDMVAARLYDVDGATQRLIARGVAAPARRRRRPDASRSSSCTRRPGPSSPATCSSSSCWRRTRSTCARRPAQQSVGGQRPAAAAAGRRRAGHRPRRADRERAGGEVRPGRLHARPRVRDRRRTAASAAPFPRRWRSRSARPASFGAFTPGVDARVHGVARPRP